MTFQETNRALARALFLIEEEGLAGLRPEPAKAAAELYQTAAAFVASYQLAQFEANQPDQAALRALLDLE